MLILANNGNNKMSANNSVHLFALAILRYQLSPLTLLNWYFSRQVR